MAAAGRPGDQIDRHRLGRGGVVGGVGTRTAVQFVAPDQADQRIVAAQAGDFVMAVAAGQRLAGGRAGDHRALDQHVDGESGRVGEGLAVERLDLDGQHRLVAHRRRAAEQPGLLVKGQPGGQRRAAGQARHVAQRVAVLVAERRARDLERQRVGLAQALAGDRRQHVRPVVGVDAQRHVGVGIAQRLDAGEGVHVAGGRVGHRAGGGVDHIVSAQAGEHRHVAAAAAVDGVVAGATGEQLAGTAADEAVVAGPADHRLDRGQRVGHPAHRRRAQRQVHRQRRGRC